MSESIRHRIADQILNDYISSGKLTAGDKLPTVRELRDIYRTSDTTIQSALSLLELWGAVKKRHGSGTFVTERSESTINPRSKLIGCISSFSDTDISIRIYDGIETVARKRGYHMLIANTRDDYKAEHEQVKRMVDIGCEAIVLYPVPRNQEQFESDYLKTSFKNFPIVLVDNAFPEQRRSQVIFDNYQAGYDMTQLLLREGHKRISFMTQYTDLLIRSVQDRFKGFLDALNEAGLEFRDEDLWVLGSPKSVYVVDHADMLSSIRPKLENLKNNPDSPTASIAVEDLTAIYTINAAQELEINVPDRFRVVGFDDLAIARMFKPEFPTTSPGFTKAGALAAELALDQATGGVSPAKSIYIHTLSVPILERGIRPPSK